MDEPSAVRHREFRLRAEHRIRGHAGEPRRRRGLARALVEPLLAQIREELALLLVRKRLRRHDELAHSAVPAAVVRVALAPPLRTAARARAGGEVDDVDVQRFAVEVVLRAARDGRDGGRGLFVGEEQAVGRGVGDH